MIARLTATLSLLLVLCSPAFAYRDVYNPYTNKLDKVGVDNANDLSAGLCADGEVLQKDGGVWVCTTAGGGGTPGGNDTDVQYNNLGSFGGDSDFTFNATTNTVTVVNSNATSSTLSGTSPLSLGASGSDSTVKFLDDVENGTILWDESENSFQFGIRGADDTGAAFGAYKFYTTSSNDSRIWMRDSTTTAGIEIDADGSGGLQVISAVGASAPGLMYVVGSYEILPVQGPTAFGNNYTLDTGSNIVWGRNANRYGKWWGTDADFNGTFTLTPALTTSNGGTGSAGGFVLNGPIFAGTTPTGSFQSGSLGSSGDVLTSNGPGSIPTFKPGGSGSGDITSVGDVTSGAAFDGTQGTVLTFNNAGGDATINYDGSEILINTKTRTTGTLVGNSLTLTYPVTTQYGGTGTLGGISKQQQVIPIDTVTVVGENQSFFPIPETLHNFTLTSAWIRSNTVAPTTGSTNYKIKKINSAASEFTISSNLYIDAAETSSATASTAATYTNNNVVFGDMVTTSVLSTGTDRRGMFVEYRFTKTDIQG